MKTERDAVREAMLDTRQGDAWIVKPASSACGRGIFITKHFQDMPGETPRPYSQLIAICRFNIPKVFSKMNRANCLEDHSKRFLESRNAFLARIEEVSAKSTVKENAVQAVSYHRREKMCRSWGMSPPLKRRKVVGEREAAVGGTSCMVTPSLAHGRSMSGTHYT